MDITPLFKACVKTVRTKNKAFGVHQESDKNRILKLKPKNAFNSKAKDIVCQITRLRDFLLDNRSAYLNLSNYSKTGKEMTDAERDQVDNGSQRVINSCSHAIQEFKKDTKMIKASPQTMEFMEVVLKIIEAYLKAVCAIQVEQKAIRVKRALDIRNLSRLESKHKQPPKSIDVTENFHKNSEIKDVDNNDGISNSIHKFSSEIVAEMDVSITTEDDNNLSPEEIQIFESENMQLYNDLNSLSEEVRTIESKVLQIAELQEVFTEKVLQQDHDIDRINVTVTGVTENVKEGNEQIKQAIQRNAGLRVWILFFLLVMSFSLLFLDWYND